MSTFYIILAIIFAKSLADVLHEDKYVVKRKTTSAVGKYLKGHVFKITKEAIDPQHCVADCWAENDQCQSLNYFPSWDICELNEASNLTNPEDLIDRPDTVYLTNPIYGHRPKPEMARHTNYDAPDPCASNPCTNAESCVNDSHLGYRCQNCHSQYTGPKCEEHLDPCVSNPCRFGGTCISTMDRWRCVCLFPFQGRHCTDVTKAYYINLNGTGDYYPYSVRKAIRFQRFVLSFWFKTQQNVSYFIHKIPKKSSDPERLTVWHAGNTFFVELWKDHVYNFSFPFSYPVNDNNWHVVAIVLQKSAELFFYLDGARRDPPRLTIGVPDSMTLYYFRDSTVYIGYFKDTHDNEHFFNGSIGKVDIGETAPLYGTINSHFVRTCTRAGNFERMIWSNVIWTGLDRHAKKVDCSARVPIMGIKSHEFPSQAASQWLEQAVSPPRDLTAFTMFFQIQTSMFFDKAIQIACYGNRGDDCHLSVVINANFTLEIIIESTRFLVHLVPVNDHKAHYVAIKWTNDGGVFELIIDGILQSTKTGIEVNGKISGQSRFIVGSSVPDKRTLDGFINNLNVWDEIITDEMLYLMTLEPGNDVGNIVAWRDFTRPSSIAEEQFSISKRDVNFRVRIVGRNNIQLYFSKPFPAYISTTATCCYVRYGMSLTMWLSLQVLPANLLRLYMTAEDTNPRIALMISPNRNITLSLNGQIASLGSWPAAASGQYADRNYNYLALSWSNNGDLFFNLNGQETHVSSNFAARTNYRLVHAKSFWVIGERHNNGSGIVGSVAQLNLWVEAKPPPLLMAMSRGINGIGSYHLSWENWNDGSYQGNVEEVEGNLYYQPDFIVQKRRDQLCNDVLPPVCVGKYRARIGMFGRSGVRWGCFCDENLSEDLNFNYGSGNYTLHFDITAIN